MNHTREEIMAALANDLFDKRQRLIKAGQSHIVAAIDDRTAKALEAEYKTAESEYLEAKAVFARAMKADKRAA
jgi:hypothetical protein